MQEILLAAFAQLPLQPLVHDRFRRNQEVRLVPLRLLLLQLRHPSHAEVLARLLERLLRLHHPAELHFPASRTLSPENERSL